jgi:hypothetical protein
VCVCVSFFVSLYVCVCVYVRLVYPLLQTYSMAGEFTILTKMRASLFENLLLYSAMGVVAGIAAIVFAVQQNLGMLVFLLCTCRCCCR